jgi:adenosylmethionine-8-amino-7-oxononanoate aminotransferase
VFFVNSCSEAVESAIKFARQYHLSQGQTRRWKVISRDLAYHGTTLGALSAAGLPRIEGPFEPLLQGFRQVSSTRSAGDLEPRTELLVAKLERAVVAEGPETVAAVIAEPVQNGGGAIVPPPGYWQGLREVCDRCGVLFVADEVICGFGRLGEWFGSQRVGVLPDLITFAKGATSGYVPMGGMVARRALVERLWDGADTFSHGATFGGHPVASSVLMANVAAIEHEGVLENVRRLAPRSSPAWAA